MSVIDVIRHYQRSIENCAEDEKRMLHCINKLSRLPVTVQHLKETGVGRTVNALRKYEGEVGEAAKYTVTKWKAMVAAEDSSDGGGEEEEEERGDCREGEDDSDERVQYTAETEMEAEDMNNVSCREELYEELVKKHGEKKSHREEHTRNKKDYNSRTEKENSRQETKSHKEKSNNEKENSSRKYKESSKHRESKNSQKRKKEGDHRKEEKRKKVDSDNQIPSESEQSESEDIHIDERVAEENIVSGESDENENYNRKGSCDLREKKLQSPADVSHSKNSSSSSNSHHHRSRHHRESHHKHEKHKERKSQSSNKHTKSDIVDVTEKSGNGYLKEKYAKHKEAINEIKDSKHMDTENKSGGKKEKSDSERHKSHSFSKADCKKSGKDKGSNNSNKKSRSVDSNNKDIKEKKKKKTEFEEDDGISSLSGASFAEALGMVDPLVKKKPTNSHGLALNAKNVHSSTSKPGGIEKSSHRTKGVKSAKLLTTVEEEPAPLLSPSVKLDPLEKMEVDLDATLPEISPNYRPLPHVNLDSLPHRRVKSMTEEEALNHVMSQKNQRTKVYSGVKSNKSWSSVPSLFEICVRVLQENIDAIEYTGGVPYDLLKPVLNHATPEQLLQLEHYNPYIVEDTDELWEFHCKKAFRTRQRDDMESWREMYMRCVDEREAKLKALTSNIQQSIAKSTPVRQTKLAYVDSVVKPPRNIAKQQAKFGTARPIVASKGSPVKAAKQSFNGSSSSSASSSSTPVTSVPPPRPIHIAAKAKPRMAPLMQKTMKLVKSFKR